MGDENLLPPSSGPGLWVRLRSVCPSQRGSLIGGSDVWLTTVPYGTRSFSEGNNQARINCHGKWTSRVSDGDFPLLLCSVHVWASRFWCPEQDVESLLAWCVSSHDFVVHLFVSLVCACVALDDASPALRSVVAWTRSAVVMLHVINVVSFAFCAGRMSNSLFFLLCGQRDVGAS